MKPNKENWYVLVQEYYDLTGHCGICAYLDHLTFTQAFWTLYFEVKRIKEGRL